MLLFEDEETEDGWGGDGGEDGFMIVGERFGFVFSCPGVYPSDNRVHSTAPQ
jgi:hypothetical protein